MTGRGGLEIFTLGGLSIRRESQPISKLANRKAEALLVYLAITQKPQSREVLAELLWEERSQSQALSNLRVVLHRLRQDLDKYVTVTHDTAGISPAVWVDVLEMQQKLASGQCEEAVALYQGDFLQGFYLRQARGFEEWATVERQLWRQTVIDTLHQLVDASLASGEWQSGLLHSRRLLQLESLDEAAHRKTMLLLVSSGQRSAAIAQFETCRKLLEKGLGVEPSTETEDLYREILAGRVAAPAGALAPPPQVEITGQLPAFLTQPEEEIPKPVFVARENELAWLEGFLGSAIAGKGKIAFVTGGPGRGKTALMDEFARLAQGKHVDLLVAQGNCNAYSGVGDPYLPFRGILNLLTGDLEAPVAAGQITRQQAARLWQALPDVCRALLEHGVHLIGSFLSGERLLGRASAVAPASATWLKRLQTIVQRQPAEAGGLEKTALLDEYVSTLRAVAELHPLLLILDDLQWADAPSASLLFHLGRRLAGCHILVVCAYRPEEVTALEEGEHHPLEKVLAEFKRAYGEAWLDLSRGDGQHFVDALLDSEPNRLDEIFRQALFQRTHGHPLFTVELLRALQERGELVQEQGKWIEGREIDWGRLPARVEGVIEERVSRLTPELGELLRIACVQGEEFAAQVVAQVQATDERRLLRQLSQQLEKRHRLVRERGETQINNHRLTRYQFTHTLFQQYFYHSLGQGERRLLHAQTAATLEEIYREQSDEICVQLVHHYRQAGEPDKAIDYMIRLADQARAIYAHAEAESYYLEAMSLLKKHGDLQAAAQTLLKLGLVYIAAFQPEKAQEAYNEAFSLYAPLKDVPVQAMPQAVLRVALEAPRTFDPGASDDDVSVFMAAQLFEGLVRIGRDYNVLPALAMRWEVAENGKQYIFHLNPEACWSDGTPLSAADFEFAWKRNLHPATHAPAVYLLFPIQNARQYKEGLLTEAEQVGVHALDDHRLEIRLESPSAYLPYLLAQPIAYPLPRQAFAQGESAWTSGNLVGNGPYVLETWQPGEKLVLSRNPCYRGEFSGNVERIECTIYDDFSSELQAYGKGLVDLVSMFNADPGTVTRARLAYGDELVTFPRPSTLFLSFRVDLPPFDDLRLRLAFAQAVNGEALAREALQGMHLPATGGFIPPGMAGHSPGIHPPYDPEAARRLLEEADYPGGKGFPSITWLQPPGSREERLIPYLRHAWQRVLGINLETQILEWGEFHNRLMNDPAHLTLVGWGADYPDPDNMLRVTFHSREGFNSPRWHNPRFDALIEAAGRETDHENRMELYRMADHILVAEEAVVLPLGYASGRMLAKPWVRLPRLLYNQMPLWNVVVNRA